MIEQTLVMYFTSLIYFGRFGLPFRRKNINADDKLLCEIFCQNANFCYFLIAKIQYYILFTNSCISWQKRHVFENVLCENILKLYCWAKIWTIAEQLSHSYNLVPNSTKSSIAGELIRIRITIKQRKNILIKIIANCYLKIAQPFMYMPRNFSHSRNSVQLLSHLPLHIAKPFSTCPEQVLPKYPARKHIANCHCWHFFLPFPVFLLCSKNEETADNRLEILYNHFVRCCGRFLCWQHFGQVAINLSNSNALKLIPILIFCHC
jgi:hypothetical protein